MLYFDTAKVNPQNDVTINHDLSVLVFT